MIRQSRLGQKLWIYEAMFQAIEVNWASGTEEVSGKLSISQFSVVHHPHNLGKSTQSSQIVFHVNKILQNFWLSQLCMFIYKVNQKFCTILVHAS